MLLREPDDPPVVALQRQIPKSGALARTGKKLEVIAYIHRPTKTWCDRHSAIRCYFTLLLWSHAYVAATAVVLLVVCCYNLVGVVFGISPLIFWCVLL